MGELVSQAELRIALSKGATYAEIVAKVKEDAAPALPVKKSSLAKRKAALAAAIKNSDRKVLARLRANMKTYVSSMADVEMTEPRVLLHTEAASLMSEHISRAEIDDLLKTRNETIRELVFTSITEANRAKGIPDPEATNGKILVPELGKKFCKEGTGYKIPQIDESALRVALGDDADKVFKTEVIPAKEITVLDEDALGALALENPGVLEALRSSLVPGEAKPARFVVRDIGPDDAEHP